MRQAVPCGNLFSSVRRTIALFATVNCCYCSAQKGLLFFYGIYKNARDTPACEIEKLVERNICKVRVMLRFMFFMDPFGREKTTSRALPRKGKAPFSPSFRQHSRRTDVCPRMLHVLAKSRSEKDRYWCGFWHKTAAK